MWKIAGKVVLVTGASRGLGRALVETFAGCGAHVAFCARKGDAIQDMEADLLRRGVHAMAATCDVAIEEQVLRLVHRTVQRFGRIDVLINNASILGPRVPIADYPSEAWGSVLAANLTGSFLVSREVVHVMRRQRAGSIINVSSSLGRKVKPEWGAYSVSKWGLEGLSLLMAEELRGTGIRVNVVDPGAMRTDMRVAACPNEDPRTLRTPREVVEVFLYLASDDSGDVTGQRFVARDFRNAAR
jgi:NAD(P)-dependent dehydrogenase (short-subunit alcohol dehydrogenase family)